jgi:predicted RNase H-like nuclease (RuvC/YqgF family)
VFGMDPATLIALAAMLVSLFGAAVKFVDRRRQLNREKTELTKKQAISEVERDSIVVRGAEGALLLMEKTLQTANAECQKRITELEEEITDLKCENTSLKQELREYKQDVNQLRKEIHELDDRIGGSNNG